MALSGWPERTDSRTTHRSLCKAADDYPRNPHIRDGDAFRCRAVGILVESHEGRPHEIEGNRHPPRASSRRMPLRRASILDLYDPYRAKTRPTRPTFVPWRMSRKIAGPCDVVGIM